MLRSLMKDGGWIGIVMLFGGALFFVALAVITYLRHSHVVMMLFFAVMASIFAGGAILGLYIRKRRYGDGPTTDEREQWIRARGDSAAGLTMTIIWSLACLIPYCIAKAKGQTTISINTSWLAIGCTYGVGIAAIVRIFVTRGIRRRESRRAQG